MLRFACLVFLFHLSSTSAYRCEEPLPLEKREEIANVVFTGTVRDIMPDKIHPNMYKGEVEIKRVMKGFNVIRQVPAQIHHNHRMVMVDGFGDPTICKNMPRKYDTKIFLVQKGQNGELKLNSSLVPITLTNIERTEAAVMNMPFKPKTRPPAAPCEMKFCAFGAVCLVKEGTKEAYCSCSETCNNVFAPVCGNDEVTYQSLCHLRQASCTQQRKIKVRSQGTCETRDPCEDKECHFGARCVSSLDSSQARCECQQECHTYGDSVDSTPVCGTDGVDYPNMCELRKAACNQFKELRVHYYGKCDPCKDHKCDNNQVCQLDESRRPVCRCSGACTQEYRPVCGSDANSYSNECMMHMASCKARVEIRVLYRGICREGKNACQGMTCDPMEECHVNRNGKAECRCPPECEAIMRPVCGSDLNTYDSECDLKRQSCITKRPIRLKFIGPCGDEGPCRHHTCNHNAICVVSKGKATCQCPSCPRDFRPVCGSDGVTYANECRLKSAVCENKKKITVRHRGRCNECKDVKCDYYGICETNSKGHTCVCPQSCVSVDAAVCGTDGKTYLNECELKVASCKMKQLIKVSSKGSCDMCANVKCRFGSECEKGKCVCPQGCPTDYTPVCGTDGQTYNNECEMTRSACESNFEITIEHEGECNEVSGSGSGAGMCDETTCQFGGECDMDAEDIVSVCVCNFNCEALRQPVCGSDGHKYGNECQMREESCRQQKRITQVDDDDCDDIFDEFCDGNDAVVDETTGELFDCSTSSKCPDGSFCHKIKINSEVVGRCCFADTPIVSCKDTEFGCCPDGRTSAPGASGAGCPSVCQCNLLGSYGGTCDPRTRQCVCKPGVGGLRCDRCEPGFWGLPDIANGKSGCTPCGCNIFGSQRDDCEQMDGKCMCKKGISGPKCNVCPEGKVLGPQGCMDHNGKMPASSCRDIRCEHGASCQVMNGVAECVCLPTCPATNAPPTMVCGTDGQTYGSECQLRLFACRLQKNIQLAGKGACGMNGPMLPTAAPDNRRTRKVTRHVATTPDTPKTKHIALEDECLFDSDCMAKNSRCLYNRCKCKPGFFQTDNGKMCSPEMIEVDDNNAEIDIDLDAGNLLDNDDLYEVQPETSPEPEPTPKSELDMEKINFNKFKDLKTLYEDPCASSPCKKGGTCIPDDKLLSGFKCKCTKGRRGDLCQKLAFGDGNSASSTSSHIITDTDNPPLDNDFPEDLDDVTVDNDKNDVIKSEQRDAPFGGMLGKELDEISLPESEPKAPENLELEPKTPESEPETPSPEPESQTTPEPKSENLPDIIIISPDDDLNFNNDTEITAVVVEVVDVCSCNPCMYGGTCQPDPDVEAGFLCLCPSGKGGTVCEDEVEMVTMAPLPTTNSPSVSTAPTTSMEIPDNSTLDVKFSVPSFAGHSYLEFNKLEKSVKEVKITLEFRTLNMDALLLYNGQNADGKGDFISISVKDGFVEFRYDLGSGPITLKSIYRVTLNRWHRVVAKRFGRDGMLKLDNNQEIKARAPGQLKSLNLNEALYVGYVPDMNAEIEKNVGVSMGLVGCVQSLHVSSNDFTKIYSLMWPASRDIITGSEISECGGDNPCASMPCMNMGSCMRLDKRNFKCVCPKGFEGSVCERGEDKCQSMPCHHGATCRSVPNGDFMCECPKGWKGTFCETETKGGLEEVMVPEFNGRSYLVQPLKGKFARHIDLEVWFLAKTSNGMLLYVGQQPDGKGDFLSLNLVNGHLQFRFDLGSGHANITSSSRIPLNVWHRVQLDRNNRKGSISIDGGPKAVGSAGGNLKDLNLGPDLYIGGFKSKNQLSPDSGVTTGFNGAIQRVYVNGRQIDDLVKGAIEKELITPYVGPPCMASPCLNGGVCVPIMNEAKCKCPMKFTGDRCEKSTDSVDTDQPVAFDGKTQLMYPNMVTERARSQKENKFEVVFKTEKDNGLILMQNKGDNVRGDYVAIALASGKVQVSYNLGKNSEKDLHVIKNPTKVNDEKWHTLTFTREKRKGILVIDGGTPVEDESPKGSTSLDSDGDLWIGGNPNLPEGLPRAYTRGFKGCIKEVQIDGVQLHLVDHRENHTSLKFCEAKDSKRRRNTVNSRRRRPGLRRHKLY
ncbi:unnamed protein product [Owenia fusiformis]|uniref:Agrin n=1 Tax=Owenia fusiformis TaxID=6347 RepID=A0A8S4MXR6_OWEFU|nr:unnamed protein product [Owenia fusiformis]